MRKASFPKRNTEPRGDDRPCPMTDKARMPGYPMGGALGGCDEGDLARGYHDRAAIGGGAGSDKARPK